MSLYINSLRFDLTRCRLESTSDGWNVHKLLPTGRESKAYWTAWCWYRHRRWYGDEPRRMLWHSKFPKRHYQYILICPCWTYEIRTATWNDADTDELEIVQNSAVDLKEENGSTNREIIGDDEGDWEGKGKGDASDDNISDQWLWLWLQWQWRLWELLVTLSWRLKLDNWTHETITKQNSL